MTEISRRQRAAMALRFASGRVALVAALCSGAIALVVLPARFAAPSHDLVELAPANRLLVEAWVDSADAGKIMDRDRIAAEAAAGERLPAVFKVTSAALTMPVMTAWSAPERFPTPAPQIAQTVPAGHQLRTAARTERNATPQPARVVTAERGLPPTILPYAPTSEQAPMRQAPVQQASEPLLVRVIANPALRAAQAVSNVAGEAGSWTATQASQLLPRW